MKSLFEQHDDLFFPPLEEATQDGLLAVGGDLSAERLLIAYSRGIFPWYNPGQPILWWSPDPRTVLFPQDIKVSRSLRKAIRNKGFEVRIDGAFEAVIKACAGSRRGEGGTWITQEMIEAYCQLNRLGHAHSIETWQHGELAGGLYGVSLGNAFFGESMFSYVTDASKVALVHVCNLLKDRANAMIDCQLPSDHLFRMGATEMRRAEFMTHVDLALQHTDARTLWKNPYGETLGTLRANTQERI